MATLMIRFWILDSDTGNKKFGSKWFNYDEQKEDIDAWLDKYADNNRVMEQTRYIKESEK